jgi:hypothetical protein
LFPLVPAMALANAWWVHRPKRRQLLLGALTMLLVAAVLYLPLGLFFVRNPQWFFNRYDQVAQLIGGPAGVRRLLDNTGLEVAGMVLPGAGDHNWRQNLAGRPALDLAEFALFVIGTALLLRRSRWPAAATLFVWLAVGLSISVVTEFPPQAGRSVMATPAGSIIMGLGLAGLWHAAASMQASVPVRAGMQLSLAGAVALSFGFTVRDYFSSWASNPALFTSFDVGLQWIATQLRQAAPEAQLFETPVYRDYPTFEYTLGPQAYARFETFNGRECFLAPALTTAVTEYAVIVDEDPASRPALLAAFPNARPVATISPGGVPYAEVYEVLAGTAARIAPAHARDVVYGGTIRLLGDDLPSVAVPAGGVLRLPLAWRLEKHTPAELKRFVHVIGPAKADGTTLYAQLDSSPCDNSVPSWQWKPGESMLENAKVELPADMPAGSYQVFTGWYDSGSVQRLAATDVNGNELGDTIDLGTIQVGRQGSQ